MSSRRVPLKAWFCIYLALAVLLGIDTWVDPAHRWIGGIPDPQQSIWFLGWVPWAIGHGHNPLLTDYLNHPQGVNLMWNTLMPLPGVVLAPVTLLFGPVVTYNVMITLAIALSTWSAHICARRLLDSTGASVAVALVYGLGTFVMVSALAHVMLALAAGPPLLLLVFTDLLRDKQWSVRRVGLILGLLVTAQLLISEELLAMEALITALGLAVAAALFRGAAAASWRPAMAAAAWAAPIAAVSWVIPLAVQFLGPHRLSGTVQPSAIFSADLLNFVLPTQIQAIAPSFASAVAGHYSGNLAEWDAYIGLPILLAATAAAWRFRAEAWVRWVAIMALLCAVLSLGPTLRVDGHDTGVPLPWHLFSDLPLLDNILAARFNAFTDLFVALLVGRAIAGIVRAAQPRVALALGVVCVFSIMPSAPLLSTAPTVPAIFSSPQRLWNDSTVILVAPYPRPENPIAMLWQAEAGFTFRMLGGYFTLSGSCAACDPPLARALITIEDGGVPSPLSGTAAIAELRALAVTRVIVGPMKNHDAAVRYVTGLLGEPSTSGDTASWTVPAPG